MKNYKSVMAARVILIFQMMQAVLRFPTSTKAKSLFALTAFVFCKQKLKM